MCNEPRCDTKFTIAVSLKIIKKNPKYKGQNKENNITISIHVDISTPANHNISKNYK